MVDKNKIFENSEYKFIAYSDVLTDIRDSFLEGMSIYDLPIPLDVGSVFSKLNIRHYTLEEILKTYIHVNPMKTNVIVITSDVTMNSCGQLSDDDAFIANSIKTINQCKRKIPLLIKNVECAFADLEDYLKTGEGEEFILQLDADREKLRKYVCSFSEFKKFAKDKGLTYILENLIDKIEFKRLFIS